ncbi:MAG: crotonobetainyl-CoA:carnitine CoA-transferase CaiB-like acyl-CoA transferase [Gammaproteobacteria bacterium]
MNATAADQHAMDTAKAEPLHGVRILDLTHLIAGPFCTMQFADAGADVIKVEVPDGEISRHRVPSLSTPDGELSAYFAAVNRGKRSVVLDLKTEDAQVNLSRLLASSDVFVTNFRESALERLGLNPHALRERYPGLIVATISAFGIENASSAKGQPGLAIVAEAISGISALAEDGDGQPTWAGFPLGDYVAGLTAYGAIVTALHKRHTTGEGRYLDISMAESLLAFNGITLAREAFHAQAGSEQPQVSESPAPYGIYPASTGHVAIGVNSDRFWQALCEAMQRSELADDVRFASQSARMNNRAQVTELVSAWSSQLSRQEVVRRLVEAGVPVSPVNRAEDILSSEILTERNALLPVQWGDQVVASIPAPAMRFKSRASYRLPQLGEHTDEVLNELSK